MKKVGKYDEQIRKMFEEGRTYREMAITLGVDEHNLRKRCVAIGCEYERQDSKHPIERINEAGAYDYMGGYENGESVIRLRCRECGTESDFSMVWIRHNEYKPPCKICREKQRAEHKLELARKREHQKNAEKEERDRTRRLRIQFVQTEMKVCRNCGGLFFGSGMYCSKRCVARYNEAQCERRRRVWASEREIDKDITLDRLYKRDGGRCHICGGLCEWDDFIIKEEQKIAGNMYPSIDHVKPLARGGAHKWDNVKLAHRICNSLKRDSLLSGTNPA